MNKPNGISVLLASQNAVQTVDLSVRSFLPFADEIIAVDNGSTDGTVQILERLADDYPVVTFINAPHVLHLDENRQIAYERSRYRWVFRGDSDFVAWTSGPRDIRQVRKLILDYQPTHPPTGFEFKANYVVRDWYHAIPNRQPSNIGRRVYQDVPGMRFCRVGKNEAVQIPGRTDGLGWQRIFLPGVHIMHADVRPPLIRFLRRYRRFWRELDDFETYPTLEAYVRKRCGDKDGTMDLSEKARAWTDGLDTRLIPYTGEYPEVVLQHLERSQ